MTYGARVGLFFGALFLIYGVHLPFLPLWLEWRGLTPEEIGIVIALPYLLRLAVSPTIAFQADRSGRHADVIGALALVSVLATVALWLASGFWWHLVAAVGLSLAMTSIMPLTEVVAVRGVREAGCDYGRMRLWGSLTFILASWLAALCVSNFGIGVVIALLGLATVATFAAAQILPGRSTANRPPGIELQENGREPTAAPQLDVKRAAGLLKARPFVLFLIACGTAQAAHASYYAFGSIHWSREGLSPPVIGALWGIGVAAEIFLFAFAARLGKYVSALGLMLLGTAGSVVRWCAMSFDPPLGALVGLQLLHALTFGASHLAAIQFISRAVDPVLQGTAQALYATVAMGVAMGAATYLCGQTYEALGGQTYLLMAALSCIGLLAAGALALSWDGERIGSAQEAR